jgi:predicted permease
MPFQWKYLIPRFRRAEERDMQEEMEALAGIAGRRELGNLTLAAENARAVWGWTWLESTLADIRYAIRTLRRQPSFTAVAVISLALGIGANAAIFSLMDALLWRDLPVREPEQLATFNGNSQSYLAYKRYAEHAGPVMEGVIAVFPWTRRLDTGGGPSPGAVQWVTGNFFEILGVPAESGRAITPQDDQRSSPAAVAVISHRYWQNAYGGQPVLGATIRVEKAPFTIVGVAPPEFFGVMVGSVPDVWLPLSTLASVVPGPNWLDQPSTNFLTIMGRLRPGVTLPQASAALTPVAIQIDIERNGPPASESQRRELMNSKLNLESAAKGLSFIGDRFSKPLRVVFCMVATGLLLACVNVMSLEFARVDERRKELTVRTAIGAGRWRIGRQLLTESLLVALMSGLAGIVIRKPIVESLLRFLGPSNHPPRVSLGLDSAVLWFVLGISVAAALISGVLPAMRATAGAVLTGLQQGSRAATGCLVERSRRYSWVCRWFWWRARACLRTASINCISSMRA